MDNVTIAPNHHNVILLSPAVPVSTVATKSDPASDTSATAAGESATTKHSDEMSPQLRGKLRPSLTETSSFVEKDSPAEPRYTRLERFLYIHTVQIF